MRVFHGGLGRHPVSEKGWDQIPEVLTSGQALLQVVPLCFSLLNKVLIKCCSHGHLAKNFLLIRNIFIHCLFLGMLRQEVPSSPFSAQGTPPSAEGRAWLSLPAQSSPGHQHSLVPGCQHKNPEMPEPAPQSLDGDTGG